MDWTSGELEDDVCNGSDVCLMLDKTQEKTPNINRETHVVVLVECLPRRGYFPAVRTRGRVLLDKPVHFRAKTFRREHWKLTSIHP
jgi:hypothetical protein